MRARALARWLATSNAELQAMMVFDGDDQLLLLLSIITERNDAVVGCGH